MEREIVKIRTLVEYIEGLYKGLKENWEICGFTLCIWMAKAGKGGESRYCIVTSVNNHCLGHSYLVNIYIF